MKRREMLVLFDLDGTLIDSAPDLAGAANDLRAQHQLPPLPYEALRPMVGSGARGMVGVSFGVAPGQPGFEDLRDAFLSLYERRMLRSTRPFDDVQPVLTGLDARGQRWGIVTNKASRFTLPIVEGLALKERAAVVIAGDTTPHAKPHPAPLLEAAHRVGRDPAHCVYVGDDERDIEAGRAAGMLTLVAAWGYLGSGRPYSAWGADDVLLQPQALLKWLDVD